MTSIPSEPCVLGTCDESDVSLGIVFLSFDGVDNDDIDLIEASLDQGLFLVGVVDIIVCSIFVAVFVKEVRTKIIILFCCLEKKIIISRKHKTQKHKNV